MAGALGVVGFSGRGGGLERVGEVRWAELMERQGLAFLGA